MNYTEVPYFMNSPDVAAVTGKSGYIHRHYILKDDVIISAVYLPGDGWEIYCLEGGLFEEVEYFPTEEEMINRINELEKEHNNSGNY